MTLGELLTQCKNKRRNTPVRVFAGCTTLYNGKPHVISVSEWVKLHPYFNCKVLNCGMVNDTFVVAI